jgi:hypothetical protein
VPVAVALRKLLAKLLPGRKRLQSVQLLSLYRRSVAPAVNLLAVA